MIPEFNEMGNLPEGIHEATIDEFEDRFATNFKRVELLEGLKLLIEDLKLIGCVAIYVDGSYVSNKILPGDIDLCWDDTDIDYEFVEEKLPILFDFENNRANQKLTYGCDIFPAYIFERSEECYFIDFFQIDKQTGLKKGIVKIKIQ